MSGLIGEEIKVIDYDEGYGEEEITVPLRLMIERLTAALAEVPEALRDNAVFQVRGYGDYVSVYAAVWY